MNVIRKIWRFYVDGFRGMTWGRPLWGLIILKLIILFAVLRVFFFKPVLAGQSDEEKSRSVGTELTVRADSPEPAPDNAAEAATENDTECLAGHAAENAPKPAKNNPTQQGPINNNND